MDNKDKGGFNYTYSAQDQNEIRKIREKYSPREEDKMERVRRLDRGVYQKALLVSLTIGILGTLILGAGMSLAMTNIGEAIGLTIQLSMLIGVIIGLAGGAVASLAYPIYNAVVKSERKKIAPEIIRLTDELMK